MARYLLLKIRDGHDSDVNLAELAYYLESSSMLPGVEEVHDGGEHCKWRGCPDIPDCRKRTDGPG